MIPPEQREMRAEAVADVLEALSKGEIPRGISERNWDIIRQYAYGVTQVELAEQHNVTQQDISAIIARYRETVTLLRHNADLYVSRVCSNIVGLGLDLVLSVVKRMTSKESIKSMSTRGMLDITTTLRNCAEIAEKVAQHSSPETNSLPANRLRNIDAIAKRLLDTGNKAKAPSAPGSTAESSMNTGAIEQ